ncbi:MAG TPA: hypothetical protein VE958_06615 [Bryobacteraceae bacterium]|jgi:hypothetical protein|nr:hypothetical protein [Bryobacteraceae bacterium]
MKRLSFSRVAAVATLGLASLGILALNPVLKADEYDRKTVISISQPLEVPGVVLPPGTYVMKLFNSSSNRHIVQFMNEDQNRQMALTFAVAAERIRPTGKTVLTMYEGSQGAPPAIRTWFYPGDTVGQEFLYSRQQALRISARTKAAVPEIETGKPVAVAPAETAENVTRSEEHSEALIARAEPAPEPVPVPEPQQAAVEPPPPVTIAQAQRTEPETPPAPAANPEAPTATSDSLPKTAGNGPLAALIGGLSFILAYGIRRIRQSRTL